MNKNKLLNHKLLEKSNLALFCIMGMLGGLLVSRALLSLFTFSLGFVGLYNINPRRWFKDKWWLLGVAWVSFYAISALWSDNTGFWNMHFNVKLPILLLPLAFTFLPPFTEKQLRIYTVFTGVILLLGACYSAKFLVNHMDYYMEAYRTAQVLPTPGKDHIRFSLSVAFFIVWSVYVWPQLNKKWLKLMVGSIAVLLAVYLHILAAKSGLVSLYLFVIGYSFYLLFARKFKVVIIGLFCFGAAIAVALKTIPTFSQRIGYISYTYIVFEQGDRSGTYGDIGRLISYKVAAREIAAHPWVGVGTGDMMSAMKSGYSKWYPQIADQDRLLPHNEVMDVALGCGIPVAIVFCIWLFYPLVWVTRDRKGFFMFIIWLLLLVGMMIEPFLEVQFGVVVYLFFLLWQRATLKQPEPAIVTLK